MVSGMMVSMVCSLVVVQVYGKQSPRVRVNSMNELRSFVISNIVNENPVVLAFLPADDDGEILHRDKKDGIYSQFMKVGNMNQQIAFGLIVENEMMAELNIPQGTHFLQVFEEEKTQELHMHAARFYQDNTLAQGHHDPQSIGVIPQTVDLTGTFKDEL